MTQSDANVHGKIRKIFENDASELLDLSAIVAQNFQTVAIANNFWK
jgi:hypothetical protein